MEPAGKQEQKKILSERPEVAEDSELHRLATREGFPYREEKPSDLTQASEAELAQCAAQVGTLLRVISALNEKMSILQAPRVSEVKTSPDLVVASNLSTASQSSLSIEDKAASTPSSKGNSVQLWAQLQGVLEALEKSAATGRAWISSTIACESKEARRHLTAATESWVRVTQVLEEMEREFGISYPTELPHEERQRYQREVLTLHKSNSSLRSSLQHQEEELLKSKVTMSGLEEERNRLQKKLLDLQQNVQVRGSLSPPTSPSSSSSEVQSLCWASPPYLGSPLLSKRSSSTCTALSPRGSTLSPTSSPSPDCSMMEAEITHLQRGIGSLRKQNVRLSSALERRKGESEQMSMILSRHEADNTALQMALKYSEECEEAYSQLLSLCEAKKQRNTSQSRGAAASRGEKPQLCTTKQEPYHPEAGESWASSSLPGGAEQAVEQSRLEEKTSALLGQEAVLRERILSLKQDKAAVCIPEMKPEGEGKLSPDTGTLAGLHHTQLQNTKKEKAGLLYDLRIVREKMSELQGMIRLAEQEKCHLEWTLMAQREQEAAGALIADCLQEELEDMRSEGQCPIKAARFPCDGGSPSPQNHVIAHEIQSTLQREQMFRRRARVLRESLDNALIESSTRRRSCEEEMARLALTHSKAARTFRSTRKKHHEQMWRLQRGMMALSEHHMTQIAGLKAKLEALEDRREETVL
ncbi:Usher syndrome type-1C protein-binding protein 1 [Arapaima gigas]